MVPFLQSAGKTHIEFPGRDAGQMHTLRGQRGQFIEGKETRVGPLTDPALIHGGRRVDDTQ